MIVLGLSGCASVEGAHPAHPITADGRRSENRTTPSGLVVSGEELDDLSSTHFGVLAFTFMNPTNDWVRIDKVNLDFGSQARNDGMVLPFGEDLVSWELATAQRNAIRHVNTTTLLSSLMIAGLVTAGAGGRSTVGAIGGVVGLGAVGAMWARSVGDMTAAATFPPAHLFATPFSVPPGLFSKKWVLLNGPKTQGGGCISSVVLEYDAAKGRERVHLRFGRSASEWQAAECRWGGAAPRRRALPAPMTMTSSSSRRRLADEQVQRVAAAGCRPKSEELQDSVRHSFIA